MNTVRLGEIADISAGNPAPQAESHFSVDGQPFVRMQDVGRLGRSPNLIDTVDRLSPEGIRVARPRLYPVGTLLIPKSGASINLNHRALLGRPAYVVSHLATLVPDTSKVLPAYLFHWSISYDPRRQAQTTSLPSLPLSLLAAAELPLPSLDEQRVIVDRLDAAAAIRRRAEAACEKARALTQSLFLDMFGEPGNWPLARLAEVSNIQSGITKGRRLNGRETRPAPYLRVANIQDGRLDLSQIKLIEAVPGDFQRFRLQAGDLLMTEGGDADKLGRCALWSEEVPNCLHQNHVFRVRVDRSHLEPEFAAVFMRSDSARGYFLRVAKRTTGIASVNKTQLGDLSISLPPLPLQRRFAERAQKINALTTALEAAIVKADAAAAALSAKVFG